MLIQVAVALLALLALSAFVFDYGVMWVSRGQAQNVGRCRRAGRRHLAGVRQPDRSRRRARTKAIAVARQNRVWAAGTGYHQRRRDVPAVPAWSARAAGHLRQGRRVSESGAGGNPLPMFFGNLVGVTDQGVRATATAQDRHGRHDGLPEALGDPRSLG